MQTTSTLFDELFDGFFNGFGTTTQSVYYSDDSEAYETDNSIVLKIDLPGYPKESISVEADKGYVTISAEKPESVEKEYIIKRRGASKFARKYKLPSTASENIDARYVDGVLELSIPKKEEANATKITVS